MDGANIFLSGRADIIDQSGVSAEAAALPLDADADADAESSKFFIHVQEKTTFIHVQTHDTIEQKPSSKRACSYGQCSGSVNEKQLVGLKTKLLFHHPRIWTQALCSPELIVLLPLNQASAPGHPCCHSVANTLRTVLTCAEGISCTSHVK